MSAINKIFQLATLDKQTVAAGASYYYDLGVLSQSSGFGVGYLRVLGTATGTWEFRVNKEGVTAGTDGDTDPWPTPLKFNSPANVPDTLELATNNTVAHAPRGDGSKKVWLKVTNTGAGAGDFSGLIGWSGGY